MGVEVFLRMTADVSRILRTKLMICWVSTAARRPCRSANPSGINHTGEPWLAIKLTAMMMMMMMQIIMMMMMIMIINNDDDNNNDRLIIQLYKEGLAE